MRCDLAPVLTAVPSNTGWDFGGYAYGLEPLTLPHPGSRDLSAALATPASYADSCRRIGHIGRYGVAAGEVDKCPGEEELSWFRWITGHQVSFIVWRMMAQLVTEVTERRPAPETLGSLSHYVRGYSAMLLYTGSSSRSTYQDVIRPSMRLHHRSFSGSWAPDYWPVRDLFRARLPLLADGAETAELLRAIRLHQLVHDGVAAKLVPDGKSLLRQSGLRRPDMRLMNLLYDNYFLTLRAPVSQQDVVGQLLRRLVAIAQDIAVNGLSLEAGEQPDELRQADVIMCQGSVAAILSQIASCANGSLRNGCPELPPPGPMSRRPAKARVG